VVWLGKLILAQQDLLFRLLQLYGGFPSAPLFPAEARDRAKMLREHFCSTENPDVLNKFITAAVL
jgi:hypothetical protein